MAVTERNVFGRIEILENGVILLRTDTIIERNGTEVTRVFNRRAFVPGEDIRDQSQKLQAIAGIVWTPAVIQAYRDSLTQGPGR